MAKGKKTNRKKPNNNKKVSVVDNYYGMNDTPSTKGIAITVGIVVGTLLIFSLISYKLSVTHKKYVKPPVDDTIQYNEILVGSSFEKENGEYLVLYYDMNSEDTDMLSNIRSAMSDYKSSDATMTIYTSNLASAFNRDHYKTDEEPNYNPTNASEMKFNGPTIVKFNNNTVVEYISGLDEVVNYIKNNSIKNED